MITGYPEDIIVDPEEVRKRREIAQEVGDVCRRFSQVCGVFMWGSAVLGNSDSHSDVDVGVYLSGPIPAEEERLAAYMELIDDPASVTFGEIPGLAGYDKLPVRGLWVGMGWWLFESDLQSIRGKLARMLDTLDDAKAENELGEIQRLLLLWDPNGLQAGLKRTLDEWFQTDGKAQIIERRLARAEFGVAQHLPRALAQGDVVWAEESRRNALNEIIRVVYYTNNRFLRRLKGVDIELRAFAAQPPEFVRRIRAVATADLGSSLPLLRELFDEVACLARERQPKS
jgi:predicted nucleotidyltransferase